MGVFISCVLTSGKNKLLKEWSIVPVSLRSVRSCSCSSAAFPSRARDVPVLDAPHCRLTWLPVNYLLSGIFFLKRVWIN